MSHFRFISYFLIFIPLHPLSYQLRSLDRSHTSQSPVLRRQNSNSMLLLYRHSYLSTSPSSVQVLFVQKDSDTRTFHIFPCLYSCHQTENDNNEIRIVASQSSFLFAPIVASAVRAEIISRIRIIYPFTIRTLVVKCIFYFYPLPLLSSLCLPSLISYLPQLV